MATKCMKLEGDGSLTPKFWKIIINPRDNMLRIPSEFVRRHGQNLPDHVSLKAPHGSIREVQLLRLNGDTWLNKGWQEFKEYYSICHGDVLLFTYDKNSHFDVQIFNMKAVEIEYPYDNANGDDKGLNLERAVSRVPEPVVIESSTDDSVVILRNISTNIKQKGGRGSVEVTEGKGNSRFVDNMEEDSSATLQRKRKMSRFPSRVKQEKCSDGFGNQSEKRVQREFHKETSIAYQKAKSCKFLDPFFICLMQPSYVCSRFTLNIQFARKFLPPTHNKLKLCDSKGNTWIVKCYIARHYSKLTRGWKGFVQDNALKVGDACVFEVNKSAPLVWKVTIFRC